MRLAAEHETRPPDSRRFAERFSGVTTCSTLAPGAKVICLISGRWGERWRNICNTLNLNVVSVTVPYGQAVQPEQLARALADHPDAVAVCATLSETSTGVGHDIAAFGKIVAATIRAEPSSKAVIASCRSRAESPAPCLPPAARTCERSAARIRESASASRRA